MRHADAADLARLEELLNQVRALGAFKEPRPGCFSLKGRAALHFHAHEERLYADLRLTGAAFDRRPVGTAALDAALLAEVRAALL
jgi:hypothetical protein